VVVTARRVLWSLPNYPIIGYVEDANRAAGIPLSSGYADWDGSLDVGSEVDVTGKVTQNADGELEIQVSSITAAADPSGAVVKPVGMTNKSLGGGPFGLQAGVQYGVGLNNIGLLVTAWGKVTAWTIDANNNDCSVFIDDGSNLTAGETGSLVTHPGIEVAIPYELGVDPTTFVADRTYLAVTGNSSTKLWDPTQPPPWDSVQKRVVRVRYASDLVYVIP